MGRLTSGQKVVVGAGIGIIGLLLIVSILALGVTFWACGAFVACNYLLPLFDIEYPLTWTQSFGVGALIVLIKAVFRSTVTVNKYELPCNYVSRNS